MAIAVTAALATPSPRADDAGRARLRARTDEDAQYPLRLAAAASAPRVPPRVYSPFAMKRLTHPMAVRADAGTSSSARARWPLFRRDTRERSG